MKKYPLEHEKVDKLDDYSLVQYLIERNAYVTEHFLYGSCWDFFVSLYKYWYTDYTGADDMAADVYIHVMEPKDPDGLSALQRFKFQTKFILWFYRVSKNLCIDHYRKHRKLVFCSYEDMDTLCKDDSTVVVGYDSTIVNNVISRMPNKRYARFLKLRYIDEMDFTEIANAMGGRCANYYKIHTRAKDQFREVLKQIYPEIYSERNSTKENE